LSAKKNQFNSKETKEMKEKTRKKKEHFLEKVKEEWLY
jgi:hypothetical protein